MTKTTPGEEQAIEMMRKDAQAAYNKEASSLGDVQVVELHKPRTTLSDGTQVYPDHREIDPKTGMQAAYVVLAEEERAKGFVRPVRRSYVHQKCGVVTTMGQTLAETYARDPFFTAEHSVAVVANIFQLAKMVNLCGIKQTRRWEHEHT